MNTAVLTPAYGRTCANVQAIQADWNANKDFIFHNATDRWCGKPCCKSDLKKYSKYTHVEIRYGSHIVILEIK